MGDGLAFPSPVCGGTLRHALAHYCGLHIFGFFQLPLAIWLTTVKMPTTMLFSCLEASAFLGAPLGQLLSFEKGKAAKTTEEIFQELSKPETDAIKKAVQILERVFR